MFFLLYLYDYGKLLAAEFLSRRFTKLQTIDQTMFTTDVNLLDQCRDAYILLIFYQKYPYQHKRPT